MTAAELATTLDRWYRAITDLEQTVASIRESLAAEDLEAYYPVLNALQGEANEKRIALAAIRLFHELAGNVVDETEIPDMTHRMERSRSEGDKFDKGAKGKFDRGDRGDSGPRDPRAKGGTTGFVYVSLGRGMGIRPGDLVGAIANETDLVGREIGPIKITEKFSVVGVPDKAVDKVIAALKSTTIKGQKPTVRRYTD